MSAREGSAQLAILAGDDRMPGVMALLERNGLSTVASTELLRGGKNNRVIRLSSDSGRRLVLKVYFQGVSDTRDRLRHEFSFATFAWTQGLRTLPQPIDAEPQHQCALFEFVEGNKPSYPPTAAMIDEAVAFVLDVNRGRSSPAADILPAGSEACFSIAQHIALVRQRIDRLLHTTGDEAALSWLRAELLPLWSAVEKEVARTATESGIDKEQPLDKRDRIISPSDFGFHNAIVRTTGGRLCFHDFEYAGWDDPAKLFGDFFNQIEMPVPYEALPAVAASFTALSSNPRDLAWRMRALLPVYAVKWCCIALNPFMATEAARRQFAGHDMDVIFRQSLDRAARQLQRAHHFHQLEGSLTDV
ncbi:aminoglycoside phosphotransferase family protein [Nordella sp. HKS 07]|uniref:phosphotransferase n=1 Tax=Nordella sp. HKS 07 TaxID=2712222 RepID=UPI0013E0F569|nr:phosphotransferase [Nordella sp. HKS 07]QIG52108.1 aminoglycoside phosphotransferase family protein [Nordella sp. HKS 07]